MDEGDRELVQVRHEDLDECIRPDSGSKSAANNCGSAHLADSPVWVVLSACARGDSCFAERGRGRGLSVLGRAGLLA